MKNNKDHEYIKGLFDGSDVKAPESLSEEKVRAMLENEEQSSEERTVISSLRAGKRRRRNFGVFAACVVLAVCLIPAGKWAVSPHPGKTVEAGEGMLKFATEKQLDKQIEYLTADRGSSMFLMGRGGDVDVIANEESATGDMDAAAEPKATAGSSMASAPGAAPEHSETYVQVEGIDEADIVKTDGTYIYYTSDMSNQVIIASAKDGKTEKIGRVNCSKDDISVDDIFIKGDKLIVIGLDTSEAIAEDWNGGYGYKDCTAVAVYDISDRSAPKRISRFAQSGFILSSRLIGDTLCVVTNDYIYQYVKGKNKPWLDFGEGFDQVSVKDITVFPEANPPAYTVISTIDTASGKITKKQVKTKAVLGGSEEIYCNGEDLYVASSYMQGGGKAYYTGDIRTRILKVSLDGGKIKPEASAAVVGRLNDQFSMDASGGYFKVATTSTSGERDSNNLFILDENMKQVSKITDFAKGEHIEAVRYIKDKAYVITYEQTDPLFIIDLADPKDPVIEGHVKISGFSTLLVPADDDHLLGIGFATENGEFGEAVNGVKLALFDVTDPAEPKVADAQEFKDMDSEVQYDHKALLVDPSGEYYAFPYSKWSEKADDYENGVLLFSAKGGKLKVIKDEKTKEMVLRAIAIENHIYGICDDDSIESFAVK